jgi:menaquinone-specific isochorismate synthase
MNPIWVDEDGTLVGHSPHVNVDPWLGPDRFRVGLEAIRDSGRSMGFASFTFDEAESGSVIVIPHHTTTVDRVAPLGTPPQGVELVDDGIADWSRGFSVAMKAIATENLAKVVLARQVVMTVPTDLDPASIVARLAAHNPACYLFAIDGLLGASPELLVRLRNGRVSTLALAGTATDPEELETVKISEEHRHVSRSVGEVLAQHLTDVELTEQTVVHHGAMSHVGTRIEGPVVPGTTIAEILTDLHPTAAVAGAPSKAAMDLIREMEPTSRGRYAGPVGWMDRDGDGVFAIALRCGQIDGSRITLFAGGGLVDGSEESTELAETDLKLAPMYQALGHPSS